MDAPDASRARVNAILAAMRTEELSPREWVELAKGVLRTATEAHGSKFVDAAAGSVETLELVARKKDWLLRRERELYSQATRPPWR